MISTIVTSVKRPTARLTQPVRSERYVELSCDMTLPGLTSFLAYNLALVLLCSVFAFKTRKLPNNFNESRFMTMCVTTTLVIWLAFIPTFVTSSRQHHKTLLLVLALLLNHTVALVFLFLPKLYAAICHKDTTDIHTRYLTTQRFRVSAVPSNNSFEASMIQGNPIQQTLAEIP